MSPRSALAGALGEHGGGDPHDPEAQGRAEDCAEESVEEADPGNDEGAPQPEADALEATGEDGAGDNGSDQAKGGRVRRGGAFGQDERSEAGAEDGSCGEPAEGEHPDDEAPAEPERCEEGCKRDDDPVER